MSVCRSSFGVDVLLILCYIFGRNRRSCRVLSAFGRGIAELLPYNKQTSRKLFPVGCVIADQKCLLTLRDNEFGDFHYHLSQDEL